MKNNKIDIDRIIYNFLLDNVIAADPFETVLNIDYKTDTGRGRFIINNLQQFLPAAPGKMKTLIDICLKAEAPQEPAGVLYNYLQACAEHLTAIRNKIDPVTDQDKKDRAQLTNEIKRYNNNIEALRKYFDFAPAEDQNATKMQKVEVLTLKYDPAGRAYKAENHTGKRFIKGGRVFHVYKVKTLTYIIIPCCGLPVLTYEGDIKAAPEYITADILEKLEKIDYIELNIKLFDIIENAENIVLNEDLTLPAPAADEVARPEAPATNETPAAAEEKTAAAAADQAGPAEVNTRPENGRKKPAPPVYIALVFYGYIPGAGPCLTRFKTGKNPGNYKTLNTQDAPKNGKKDALRPVYNKIRPEPRRDYITPGALPRYNLDAWKTTHAPRAAAACCQLFYNTS